MLNAARLATIRVLYRQSDTMSLWGIPYRMRADVGQQPRDIDPARRKDWVWLGSPGWWGSMTRAEQAAVAAFLATLPKDAIPEYPNEWIDLADWAKPSFGGLAALVRKAD